MRISLFLMTQKGKEVLDAVIHNGFSFLISKVIIGRDKSLENDFSEDIIFLCKQNNISYFERTDNYIINSDYSVAVSWRWLISENKSILIVLHDSLLPKFRGFAPLVNMLINKEPRIGVTAILASNEYDKGNIIAQSSKKINYPIKISEAVNLISECYVELIILIFNKIKNKEKIHSAKQNEALASYSLWRDEDDYQINWGKSSEDILNFINAVSFPYKGAKSTINKEQTVRILDAEIEKDVIIENRDAGKVIFVKDSMPVVVCGTGLLKLTKIIDDKTKKNILPLYKFRIRFI